MKVGVGMFKTANRYFSRRFKQVVILLHKLLSSIVGAKDCSNEGLRPAKIILHGF